jgi:NTE family protein
MVDKRTEDMKRLRWIMCVACLLFTLHSAYSLDSVTVNDRPKVGLVLSGGGAKGAAHLGVLKYLEETGIPIDYIAGTSMGSVVGGMYALGYSTDEILEVLGNADWNRLISNEVDRRKISFTRKLENETLVFTLPFSLTKKNEDLQSRSFKNSLPKGFVTGDNIINLFNSLAVGYADSLSFGQLPIPFICMATDMLSGEAAVLDKGEFTKALRASMAIPVLFDPVKMNQTLYADGGLSCNFPAEQCKAMGADYIIGVSMSPGLEDNPDNLSSVLQQIKQLKEIITDKDFDRYHEQCDIFISPDLKGVGMLSFNAESVARVTQSGYEAAAAQAEKFEELKRVIFLQSTDSVSKVSRQKKAVNIIKTKVRLSEIEFVGVDRKLDKWLRRVGKVGIGEMVNKNDIDESVSIYYGTGNFKSVTYTLHEDLTTPDSYILRFNFVEKNPHDFGLGLRFDTQDMLSVLLHVGINSNRMSGFKTNLDAKLGGNQWLKLNVSYGYMLYPKINFSYHFRNSELDVYDMEKLSVNEKFLQHNFRLYLSENHTRTFGLGAGLEMELMTPTKVMYSGDIATKDMDYQTVNVLGSFAYFHFDNLNTNRFATRGVKGRVEFKWKDCTFNTKGIKKFQMASLVYGFEGYVPVIKDRLVFVPQLYGSFLFGKGAVSGKEGAWNELFQGPVPMYPYMNNLLGGAEMGRYIDHQLPFIGVNKTSFAFNNLAIIRLDMRVRVYKKHYLTAMVNYGRSSIDFKNFFQKSDELLWGNLYDYNASNWWGAGIRYSLDTKLGPLAFDVSSSNISKRVNIYFSFGYYF